MYRPLLLATCIFSFAVFGNATEIEVVVRPATALNAVSSSDGTLVASAVVRREPKQQQPLTVALSVPGHAMLDLPAGVWRLQIKAPGWFHAGDIVTVGKERASVVVPIWRLGSIHGKAKTSDNAPMSAMTARWSARSTQKADVVPDGETECVVSDGEYRCAVPVGLLDVKLRAPGYGSQFLWQTTVPPTEVAELPLIHFKRGAGIYGWVTVGEGVRFDPEQIRVKLNPASDEGAATRPVIATVNDRGFFAFSGTDPGSFKVSASAAKDVASDEIDVVVRLDGETELLEPLTLQRRVPLRVAITPPLDSSGAQWEVAVTRSSETGSRSHTMIESTADATGVASIAGLAGGSYELTITPKGKATAFAMRSIEIPRDANLTVNIKTTRVLGSVRLKDNPLAGAVLWIGGKNNNPSVTLTSNAEGEYSGLVPFDPEGTWEITVSSATSPAIERTIRQRPTLEDERTVRLDLVLPAGAIEGTVVEANGSAATKGVVNVLPAASRDEKRTDDDGSRDDASAIDDKLMQTGVNADGRFQLVGLEAGDYIVYAEGRAGRTSARSLVNVSKDAVSSVKLTLGAGLPLSGRVTTDAGTAVAGATVYVNSVEVATPVWIPRATSTTGEFTTLLPDATRTVDIFVAARGFAFKAFRAPLNSDRQLMIVLRQNGGSLAVRTPTMEEDPSGRIPYIVHEATAIPLMFFLSNGLASVKESDSSTLLSVAPQMEAGAYGLCFATPAEITPLQSGRCSFGNLPPFGSLALSIGPTP